ncbi:hypothetical protein RZS08_56765, partial [Arthrospira platensis SPKY1]|nr:hypothetical protein [Arthrospira platensis SPKY1]
SQELVFQTDALRQTWPEACPPDWPYAGMLACQLGQEPDAWVVMLRDEQVRLERWAGNPHDKPSGPAPEQLTPRTSFATWVESVRHRARPWQSHETHAILE